MHGAGRSGRDAWPTQDDADAVFAEHSADAELQAKAETISRQIPAAPVVVIAHSLGAVAVAVAADAGRLRASHFVLVEPALYDIARGSDPVERHIAAMTSARRLAAEGDLYGYWRIVSPLMFGRPASRDHWAEDRPLATRFASLEPPWGHGGGADVFEGTPTLVVTGAWNAEYEAIAAALAESGATHVRLPGHKHRPQDHVDFNPLVDAFERGELRT